MPFATYANQRVWRGVVALCVGVTVALWLSLAARAEPPIGGAINIGVQLEPPNLDPTTGAAAAVDEIVYANIFEGLTRITEDGRVAPALATSWTVSADGLVYDFALRSDVRFHDGSTFDGTDVVFTFDRARREGSTNAQHTIWSLIANVETTTPQSVRFTLKEPIGAFPNYLGWGDAVIVAPESADENAARPVGTGPFRFREWRRGAFITLERNVNYWGERPHLEQATFLFIPDPSAAFAALMAGDVDGFPNYPAAENLALLRQDDRFQINIGTGEGEMIVAINNATAPFNDLRVRRALAHAVNRRAIIDAALFGYGKPIGSHFPPHHGSYVDLTGRYPYDPARARALLAEAGFPDGFKTTLHLPPPAYARRSGEVIAAQLAAVGIDVEIQNIEWAQWLDQVFGDKNYALTIVAHTEPDDIDIYARGDYYFQYTNPTFNQVINGLRVTRDETERDHLLKRAQRIIAEDAVNLFIAQGPRIGVWNKGVSGVWTNASVQANDITNAANSARTARTLNETRNHAPSGGGFVLVGVIAALIGAGVLAGASPRFLAARTAGLLLSLLVATLIIFGLIELAPGDAASFMMGVNASPEALAALRSELGLDRPAVSRYFSWIAGLVVGDFGVSYTYRIPVGELIAERLWVSLPLAVLAFLLSTAIAIPAGAAAAMLRRKLSGRAIVTIAQGAIAIPNFWLAILLVLVFSVNLKWFSAGGFPGWDAGAGSALKSLFLPALALAVPQAAILTQIMRSAMIETLGDDYVRTARAKGASPARIVRVHALRNALIPVLTILGLQFGFLVAGAVIIENVFYLPGLGRLAFQSIVQRDLIVVKSIVVILVFIVMAASFMIDIASMAADPRLRRPAT